MAPSYSERRGMPSSGERARSFRGGRPSSTSSNPGPLVILCFASLTTSVRGHNGYVASFTAYSQVAGTRVPTLNASNSEIARLASGLTVSMWMRFHDPGPALGGVAHSPFNLVKSSDANFLNLFQGENGGWEFGTQAPATVSTLGESSREWHHYVFAWESVSGSRTHYVDGVAVSQDTAGAGASFLDEGAFIHLGMGCHPYTYYDADQYTSCLQLSAFHGEMDDVAVFAGALSDDDVASRWNASLTDRLSAGEEPDLVIFWNFNDPISDPGWIANLGRAGSDYDLRLGALPKPGYQNIFGSRHIEAGQLRDFIAPAIVSGTDSSNWTVPKALDSAAPIVTTASAGETVAVSEYSTTLSYTAPSTLVTTSVVTTTDTYGNAVAVHVVPRVAPVVPASTYLSLTGREDTNLWIWLFGTCASGGMISARVTRLTGSGTLFSVPRSDSDSRALPITNVGQRIVGSAAYVLYVPHADSYGRPSDSFEYVLEADGLTSQTATVVINIEGQNDLPTGQSDILTLTEDSVPNGVLIRLNATDAEMGTALERVIKQLQTKGRLFQTSDGTLSGARTPILTPYNLFDVGSMIEQYASRVISVSSFWGSPPYAGYHPLNFLGPPDCSTYGECPMEADW
jgi:hypothetical protein